MTAHARPDRLHKCKCDDCRARHTEWKRQWRARRAAQAKNPRRTYGEPWDSIIAAGADWSVPRSGSPRSNDKIKGGAK